MQFSIGLYALIFITIFILVPGYITRRFYFNGQFSKQILWSSKSLSSLFYSLITGTIVILIFILIYNHIFSKTIDIDEFLLKFHVNFISNKVLDDSILESKFKGLSNSIKRNYFPFLAGLYFFSAFIGFAFCKFILYLGLDVKFKLFRFANEWHYLFSGKILKFENPTRNGFNNNLQVKHLYLDVLVNEGEKNTLYSGFFGDYDLSHQDYNKLEKLHLIHPSRYKKNENDTVKKSIPGDIFTIMGNNIININSTYVYQNEEDKNTRKFNFKKVTFLIIQLVSILIFFFFSFYIIFPFDVPSDSFLAKLTAQSFLVKLFFLFTINISTGLITPFIINNEEKKIEFIGKGNFIKLIAYNLISVFITYISWNLNIGMINDLVNSFFSFKNN